MSEAVGGTDCPSEESCSEYTDESTEDESYTEDEEDEEEGEEGEYTEDDMDLSAGELVIENTDGAVDEESGSESEYTSDESYTEDEEDGETTDKRPATSAPQQVTLQTRTKSFSDNSDVSSEGSYTESETDESASSENDGDHDEVKNHGIASGNRSPLPSDIKLQANTGIRASESSVDHDGESDTSGIATDYQSQDSVSQGTASPRGSASSSVHASPSDSSGHSPSPPPPTSTIFSSSRHISQDDADNNLETSNLSRLAAQSCESLGGELDVTSLDLMSEEEINKLFTLAGSTTADPDSARDTVDSYPLSNGGKENDETVPGDARTGGQISSVTEAPDILRDKVQATNESKSDNPFSRDNFHDYYRRSGYRQNATTGYRRDDTTDDSSVGLEAAENGCHGNREKPLRHTSTARISAVKLSEFDTAPALRSPVSDDVIHTSLPATCGVYAAKKRRRSSTSSRRRSSTSHCVVRRRDYGRTVISPVNHPASSTHLQYNHSSHSRLKSGLCLDGPPKPPRSPNIPAINVTQSTPDTHEETVHLAEKKAKKRARVIQEILHTEQTYQNHLKLIIRLFEEPLKERNIIPPHVIVTMFSNIGQIMSVNLELFQHLTTHQIGEAFLLLGPFLKLYSTYANNHERALATMIEWDQKSKEFAQFRRKQEEEEEMAGLKLNALLITPVQRVPRYKLLLEELLENTNPDHLDYPAIQEAVKQITAVAYHINEHIRQQENCMRMLAIQKSLSGHGAPRLLTPGRIFIKEGNLKKVSRKGGRSYERRFYLFSDMLMYAKPKLIDREHSYTCCCLLPLQHCQVKPVFGHSQEKGALFTVECKEESLLLYSDQKTVDSWVAALQSAISRYQSHRKTLRKASSAKQPLRRAGLAQLRKQQRQADPLTHPFRQSSDHPGSPTRRTFREMITSPIANMRRHGNSPDNHGNNSSPLLRPKKRVLQESGSSGNVGRESSISDRSSSTSSISDRSSSVGEKWKRGSLMQCLSPRRKNKKMDGAVEPERGSSSPWERDRDALTLPGCFRIREKPARPLMSEPTLCDMPETMPVPQLNEVWRCLHESPSSSSTSPATQHPAELSPITEASFIRSRSSPLTSASPLTLRQSPLTYSTLGSPGQKNSGTRSPQITDRCTGSFTPTRLSHININWERTLNNAAHVTNQVLSHSSTYPPCSIQ